MAKNEKRIIEMQKMRDSGKTLREIADFYSISRERVRQIIGNTGRSLIYEVFDNSFTPNSEMTVSDTLSFGRFAKRASNKLRNIWHRVDGDNSVSLGNKAEKIVSEKLNLIGIKNKLLKYGSLYDLELDNGYKVDVKSSEKPFIGSAWQKNDIYRFALRKNVKGNYCDFFIFYIYKTGNFFVIPNKEIGMINSIYISDPKPARSWSKWYDFKDRFDLLEKK